MATSRINSTEQRMIQLRIQRQQAEARRRQQEQARKVSEQAQKQAQQAQQAQQSQRMQAQRMRDSFSTQAPAQRFHSWTGGALGAQPSRPASLKRELSPSLSQGPKMALSAGVGFNAGAAARIHSMLNPSVGQRPLGIDQKRALDGPQVSRAATSEPPTTPAEQARIDAQEIQETYDRAIEDGHLNSYANAKAAERLGELVEENGNDPAYANALIQEAGPQIDRMSEELGRRVAEDVDDSGEVEVTRTIVNQLSDVAAAAGPVGAQRIAASLAREIPDQDELRQFDDRVDDYVKDGGSPLLRASLLGQFEALGKGEAKGELEHQGRSFLDRLGDVALAPFNLALDAGGALIGVLESGADFASDVVEGTVDFIGEAGEFVGDVAEGTVDFIGDLPENAAQLRDAVEEGLEFAIENGLELGGELLAAARGFGRDMVLGPLNIEEKVGQLNGPGDQFELSIEAGASLGGGEAGEDNAFSLEAGAGITVTQEGENGPFTLAAHGNVTFGATVEGQVEWSFDTKAEAQRAAETIALQGAAAATPPPLNLMIQPGPDDLRRLGTDNISAITLDSSTGASIGAELEFGPLGGGGANASIGGEVGATIEFEDGRPSALVTHVKGTASAQAGAESGPIDFLPPTLLDALGVDVARVGGDASLTLEASYPLNGDVGIDDIIRDPLAAVGDLAPQVTLSGEADLHYENNDDEVRGLVADFQLDIDTPALLDDLNSAFRNGDIGQAWSAVTQDIDFDSHARPYVETGFNDEFSIGIPGVISANITPTSTVRDYE